MQSQAVPRRPRRPAASAGRLRLRRYGELEGKTFLLGVGAMKCATSTLWQTLQAMPGMTVSPLKEVHFFDTKFARNGIE